MHTTALFWPSSEARPEIACSARRCSLPRLFLHRSADHPHHHPAQAMHSLSTLGVVGMAGRALLLSTTDAAASTSPPIIITSTSSPTFGPPLALRSRSHDPLQSAPSLTPATALHHCPFLKPRTSLPHIPRSMHAPLPPFASLLQSPAHTPTNHPSTHHTNTAASISLHQ